MAQTDLFFVNVQPTASDRTFKGWVDKTDRRKIRVTVMHDYLRSTQKEFLAKPNRPRKLDMKTQMARFRIGTKARRVGNQFVGSKPVKKSSAPRRQKPSEKNTEPDGRILALDRLGGMDPFNIIPIDVSNVATQTLLEYYFKSYWSNALAVNPNGGWTRLALRDAAILHAKLSLVAVHKADQLGESLPPAYLIHRGQALHLLSERLAEGGDAFTDQDIGGFVILSSSDYHSGWPDEILANHARGIKALVDRRGGIDAPDLSMSVSRVIAWLDLMQAAFLESPILLGKSKYAVEPDPSDLGSLTGHTPTVSPDQRVATQGFPPYVKNIIRQLRVLSDIKHTLSIDRKPTVREIFSNMLWKTEYDIIELSDEIAYHRNGDDTMFECQATISMLRDAFLVYSYIVFRDQNSTALFKRLVKRLQRYTTEVLGSMRHLGGLSSAELLLLVWVCFTGWKATRLARIAGGWYTDRARSLVHTLAMIAATTIKKRVSSIVWDKENDDKLFGNFWAESQAAETSNYV